MHQSKPLFTALFRLEYIRAAWLPHRICIVIQMQLSVSEYIKSNTLLPIHDDVHDLAFSYNYTTLTQQNRPQWRRRGQKKKTKEKQWKLSLYILYSYYKLYSIILGEEVFLIELVFLVLPWLDKLEFFFKDLIRRENLNFFF